MELNPYLSFNGKCEAAFKFYEKCLGGKIIMMMTHGQSPMKDQTPADWQDKIMHARMTVGDRVLMGADAPPQYYSKPQGFSVSLSVTDPADAERKFNALAENGTVQMPLQQTFWAVRFGVLIDQFGIPWMINCEQAA
ncbi:MAG TPA: VOC family protein [Candidatus Binataceae bacterium]|nr:VOC family protein [Candidatus Binataceae bacterium]